MKWMLVTDSSCDLKQLDTGSPQVGFSTVPFIMDIEGREYVDSPDLDVPAMVDAMEAAKSSHSACPSPDAWQSAFQQAEKTLALTISSRLSGSFNSALVGKSMAQEEDPGKEIEVVDSLSTGPKLVMQAQLALKMIQSHASLAEVTEACRNLAARGRTIFTLNSFHNLVQNGRVGRLTGFLASKLGVRVIGVGSPEGEIQMKEVVRGEMRTMRKIVKDMEENGYAGDEMVISHCMNESAARSLIAMIQEKWQNAKVLLLPTRGLDSYYAERGGLIICYPMAAV